MVEKKVIPKSNMIVVQCESYWDQVKLEIDNEAKITNMILLIGNEQGMVFNYTKGTF